MVSTARSSCRFEWLKQSRRDRKAAQRTAARGSCASPRQITIDAAQHLLARFRGKKEEIIDVSFGARRRDVRHILPTLHSAGVEAVDRHQPRAEDEEALIAVP